MNIDLMISKDHINKDKLEGKTVVVIDMLRATSVIVTAINNGCAKVIPVVSIEEAFNIISNNKGKESRKEFILGGERKALKIEGFDCTNSPLEYGKDMVEGKTLIMTTTNGTWAIKNSKNANNILIGAMINGSAVAKKCCEIGQDVVIVNAGTNGEFSMDDFICSGYIIEKIKEMQVELQRKVELSDISRTANLIYNEHKDIESFICNATHYHRLKDLNLLDDLSYCMQKDIIDVVPQCVKGNLEIRI